MRPLLPQCCIAGALLLSVLKVDAQTGIWTGGGGADENWSDFSNWNAGVPANNGTAAIRFTGSTAFDSVVDLSWSISTVTVASAAGALILDGSGGSILTFAADFTDGSSSHVTIGPGLGLAGTSGGNVVINGGGMFTINSANNTYSGSTIVTAGTLSDGTAGAFSPNSVLYLDHPGVAHVNYNETIAGLADYTIGNGSVVIAGGATLSMAGGSTTSFSGVISGSGGIELNNGQAQTLTGASTYSGGTLVTGGSDLFVGSNTAVGTGTLTFSANTGLSPTATVTLANAIVLNGTGGIDNNSGNSDLRLNGLVSGTNGLEWATTGILTLINSNTFAGGVDMQAGSLRLGNNSAAGTGTITLGTNTIMGASGSPGMSLILANAVDLAGSAEQIGAGGDNFITLNGVVSGSGALTYNGGATGTVTLNAANTFSGTVAVNSGTVFVENNAGFGSASNAVSVNNGSGLSVGSGVTLSNPLSFTGMANVLSGNGTIAAFVTADTKVVVSPGSTLGNLTFSGGLNLTTGGSINFHLFDADGVAGTGYSLITVTGGLTTSASPGTLTFNLISVNSSGTPAAASNFNPASPYSWMFATSTSAISGFSPSQFNIVTTGFSNSTNGGTFSISESGDTLLLNFTPVPEPETWAMIALGALAIVPFARRRQQAPRR